MPLKAYLFLESFLFCFLTDIGESGCVLLHTPCLKVHIISK